MPRPYDEDNSQQNYDYKKLADLEEGSVYAVSKTWQVSRDYGRGDGMQVQVSLLLADGSGTDLFIVNGNTKLKKMLLDSHVNSIDEKWLLAIGESYKSKQGYNVVTVDLRQGDLKEVAIVEDNSIIPF